MSIPIPNLEITKGWLVSELTTIQQCTDAEAFLTKAIVKINEDLAKPDSDAEWIRRATFALRMKRVALQAVARRRGEIRTRLRREATETFERRFINECRARNPNLYQEVMGAISPT